MILAATITDAYVAAPLAFLAGVAAGLGLARLYRDARRNGPRSS